MDRRSTPIVVEQLLAAPASKVWQIITELAHMKQWFFENIPDFKAERGFQTSFPVVSEGRTFTHQWAVTNVDLEKTIIYAWKYAEYPGLGHVNFTLIPQGEQCTIVVTNLGLDSFPEYIPEFSWANCYGGWVYFIRGSLKNYVDKIQTESTNS